MINIPAMIIDFEATDASKEAEATQIGYRSVEFDREGCISAERDYIPNAPCSPFTWCKPNRAISYGAMAVSHITPADLEKYQDHESVVQTILPGGKLYVIGHNIDFDIQVAANAGVDTSQYMAICTQALARRMLPDLDSYSLGALTYAINPELARKYCRNAHNAGYDVTFTLWLLEHLCVEAGITNMEQLYLASEAARTPIVFDFGKHKGEIIKEVACHVKKREYFKWIFENINDKPYLLAACNDAINSIKLLNWTYEVPGSSVPINAPIDNGDCYHVYASPAAAKPYTALKKVGGQVVGDGLFDTIEDAKAWCVKHFNIGAFFNE